MLRHAFTLAIVICLLASAGCTGSSSVFLDAPVIGAGDAKAPSIAIKNLDEGVVAIPGEPFTVAVTDEASTLGNVEILYNGAPMVDQAFNAYAIAKKFEVGIPVGTQTLEVTASDAAGNESHKFITFTVVETAHAVPVH